MDIYKKYGLTKEIAAAKGIRPIDLIAIESPDFAAEASFIPEEVSNLIEKYELVWTLSIEATYGQRRRWNEFLAVRELLQNSLDAEHEAVGYDRIAVKIEQDEFGTWIKDRGKGITYKAFILGGEEKACEMRGAYGEGLKIGLIWFTKLSGTPHHVYFFTRNGIVFKCYYSEIADALVIVFGKSKRSVVGTHVFLRRYFMPKEMYEAIYYKAAKLKTVCKESYATGNCPVEMPNLVLYPGGSLYARDIYVNEISKMVKPSWFSYNLWWVELEPNRVMVNSAWQLNREVAQLAGHCLKITDVIDTCLLAKEYGGIKYYMLDEKYFETRIEYSAPGENVQYAVKRLLSKYKIITYSEYGDFDGVGAVAHEGGICVLAPQGTHPLLAKLPRAAEFVAKHKRDTLEKYPKMDERRLDGYARGRLQMYRLFADTTTIVVVDGKRCHYEPKINTIFLVPDVLTYNEDQRFFHELGHAYGYKSFPEALDLTENFERALADVAAGIFSLMSIPRFEAAVNRCSMNMCIHATSKRIIEFYPPELLRDMPEKLKEALFREPTMFIIAAPGYGYAAAGSTIVLGIPFEEHYDKFVKERIACLEAVRRDFRAGKIGINDVDKRLKNECRLFSHTSGTRLEDILDVSTLTIYIYDYKDDNYKEYYVI